MPGPPKRSRYITDSDIAVRDFLARRPRPENYAIDRDYEAAKADWLRMADRIVDKFQIGLHDLPVGQKISSED